jgi:hypothetical protein
MDKFEPRFVIKFLFTKGLRSKAIQTALETTSCAACIRSQVKEWIGRFRTGYCLSEPFSHRPTDAVTFNRRLVLHQRHQP